MTTTTDIAPVEKTVTVPATPERAFALFTDGMNDWWPGHRHSVSAGEGTTPRELVFETRPGGAIYEVKADGTRCDWGVVEVWEPGQRVEMTWHPGETNARATRVAVSFDAVDDGCRVRLTHSGWKALVDGAGARRDSYDSGWKKVLEDFRAALTS